MLSFFKCATATHVSIISEQWGHVYPLFLFVVDNFYSRRVLPGSPGAAGHQVDFNTTTIISITIASFTGINNVSQSIGTFLSHSIFRTTTQMLVCQ
jgi:hypothetical protein